MRHAAERSHVGLNAGIQNAVWKFLGFLLPMMLRLQSNGTNESNLQHMPSPDNICSMSLYAVIDYIQKRIEGSKEKIPIEMSAQPCPFCGSTQLIIERDKQPINIYICCDNCNTQGPDADSLDEALHKWNWRP
jgi:Lar family restriction alleviation protein